MITNPSRWPAAVRLLRDRGRDYPGRHGDRSRRRIEDVLALIQKHNLQVKQIVITHAHIDHVGGAMKLRAATGAPILLNQNDYALLKMLDVQAAWIGVENPGKVEIDQSIGQWDTIQAGPLSANVIHTPGHTEGSVRLYFPARRS